MYDQGTVTLTDCTIMGNSSTTGSGVEVRGTATLIDCSITGNSASTSGGGLEVFAAGNSATLIDCTIAGNTSANGGGINANGSLTLVSCTVAGNTATVQAGGVRTYERLLEVRAIGVTRVGATATKAILDGARAQRKE